MNIISQFIFENPSALERAGLIDWHSMVSYHMPTHIASILGLFSTQNALVKLGRVALVICHTTSHQVVHYVWNWKVKSKYQWFFQNLKLKYRNEKESNNTVFENHRKSLIQRFTLVNATFWVIFKQCVTIYFLDYGDFDAYDISMCKNFYTFYSNADK